VSPLLSLKLPMSCRVADAKSSGFPHFGVSRKSTGGDILSPPPTSSFGMALSSISSHPEPLYILRLFPVLPSTGGLSSPPSVDTYLLESFSLQSWDQRFPQFLSFAVDSFLAFILTHRPPFASFRPIASSTLFSPASYV